MKPVYYISYSDSPEKRGFVFPNELQNENYSIGMWVIELLQFEKLRDIFEFDAIENNEVLSLKMTRVNRSVFQVNTFKYGKFYFRIIPLTYHYNKYVGNSKLISHESRLYRVVSMDIEKLEQICLRSRFFFIGRGDNDLEFTNKL